MVISALLMQSRSRMKIAGAVMSGQVFSNLGLNVIYFDQMYSWWYIYIYNILFSTCSWYFCFMLIAWFYLINGVLILILKFNWKVLLRIWNRRKYLITCNARNRFQVINCIIHKAGWFVRYLRNQYLRNYLMNFIYEESMWMTLN